jgi:hypothetical protein
MAYLPHKRSIVLEKRIEYLIRLPVIHPKPESNDTCGGSIMSMSLHTRSHPTIGQVCSPFFALRKTRMA